MAVGRPPGGGLVSRAVPADPAQRFRERLVVLRVLIISLLVALLGRLWYLQVVSGPSYRQAAAANHIRDVVLPAPRGLILDDMGRPLVDNRTTLVLTVDRATLLAQPDGGRAVLDRLAGVVHLPVSELRQLTTVCGPGVRPPCWSGSPYQPIPVGGAVSPATAVQIEQQGQAFPGVTVSVQPVRAYPRPDGALAAHTLGYLGPISPAELARLSPTAQNVDRNELVGRAGLEASYNGWLSGRPGIQQVTVSAAGAVIGTVGQTPPLPGDTLITSLDARVQAVVQNALGYGIDRARSRGKPVTSGAAVVLDARTGRVVAMASYPSYNPEVFVGGISAANYRALTDPAAGVPLLDRAIQGQYPPGSTFKLATASGAVMEGTASFSGLYPCPGSVTLGNRVFHNFADEALGMITLHQAIVASCDTVFYGFAATDWYHDQALIAAGKPPLEAVQHMAMAYGLGRPTGIDLPGERAGLIQDRASKLAEWKTYLRANACAGAKRRAPGDPLKALDEENCLYGWQFRLGDQANFDIGQGTVLVTPIQLAVAYAVLCNGGTVYSPRIGKAIVAPDGRVIKTITPPVRGHVPVRPDVLANIMSAMYDVTRSGTAAGAFAGFPFGQVDVGGKTGTSQIANDPTNTSSWFASFAGLPGHRPQYVAVVVIPKGGQGANAAAPAVRQIWDGIYGLTGAPPALPGDRPPLGLPRLARTGVSR